ncbi:hypothetical protein ACSTI6_23565, partial [Vibrio parahaemolyticus]
MMSMDYRTVGSILLIASVLYFPLVLKKIRPVWGCVIILSVIFLILSGLFVFEAWFVLENHDISWCL